TRGIYKLAEEKGEGGWRKLEQCHREERVESYRRVADIVIDADNKTPEEIVLASLDKIKERFGINIIEQIKDVNLHSKWTF
ncbi:MAG: hypothetical protein Q8R79_01645, partial [Legionellaceae bacterium]|nr:hypothetical protein [Legionellaceae bacterium]